MTVKLNLTIEEEVVKRSKLFAKKRNLSISKIVQEYLDKATQNEMPKKESFVQKYKATLNTKLSDKEIKKITDQRIKEKYGY